jgi:hypothetical protein
MRVRKTADGKVTFSESQPGRAYVLSWGGGTKESSEWYDKNIRLVARMTSRMKAIGYQHVQRIGTINFFKK